MGRLRSSVVALFVIAMVAGMVAGAGASGPEAMPEAWRGQFFTHSWGSSRELFVVAFWCTTESQRLFFGGDANLEFITLVMQTTTSKWPGRQVLEITVLPEAVGRFYWWPTSMVLVQGYVQYDVKPADLLAMTDSFSGGKLYTTAIGFLGIPPEIDTTKPFQLWYDDEQMTLGPFLR